MQFASAAAVEAVDSIQRRWSAALRGRDVSGLVSLYCANAQLFGGRPDLFTGHAGVRKYFQMLAPQARLGAAFGVRSIVQLSDDVIVSAGYVTFSREGATDSALAYRLTLVLARQEGEWRIASHHASARTR